MGRKATGAGVGRPRNPPLDASPGDMVRLTEGGDLRLLLTPTGAGGWTARSAELLPCGGFTFGTRRTSLSASTLHKRGAVVVGRVEDWPRHAELPPPPRVPDERGVGPISMRGDDGLTPAMRRGLRDLLDRERVAVLDTAGCGVIARPTADALERDGLMASVLSYDRGRRTRTAELTDDGRARAEAMAPLMEV